MQKFVHRKESKVRENNGKNRIKEKFFAFFETLRCFWSFRKIRIYLLLKCIFTFFSQFLGGSYTFNVGV